MTTYIPNDQNMPLLMTDYAFEREYNVPINDMYNFVYHLFAAGYRPSTLRDDLANMYVLKIYILDVANGGHREFVFGRGHPFLKGLQEKLKRAALAATMIGLPD